MLPAEAGRGAWKMGRDSVDHHAARVHGGGLSWARGAGTGQRGRGAVRVVSGLLWSQRRTRTLGGEAGSFALLIGGRVETRLLTVPPLVRVHWTRRTGRPLGPGDALVHVRGGEGPKCQSHGDVGGRLCLQRRPHAPASPGACAVCSPRFPPSPLPGPRAARQGCPRIPRPMPSLPTPGPRVHLSTGCPGLPPFWDLLHSCHPLRRTSPGAPYRPPCRGWGAASFLAPASSRPCFSFQTRARTPSGRVAVPSCPEMLLAASSADRGGQTPCA